MQNLVLPNSQWQRGKKQENYLLHPRNSKQCCIGIDGSAAEISEKLLIGEKEPIEIYDKIKAKKIQTTKEQEKYFDRWTYNGGNSRDAENAMAINDSTLIASDLERIERLRPIFARHGINLVFDPHS
jgi:hypothetical protein